MVSTTYPSSVQGIINSPNCNKKIPAVNHLSRAGVQKLHWLPGYCIVKADSKAFSCSRFCLGIVILL